MAEPLARALLSRLEAPLAARLRTARELYDLRTAAERAPEPAAWAAALPELAALLPDGLPRGALTELTGRRSSGRMGLVTALLAAATAAGENAALVDLGDGLDPQHAAAAGVALERLLWARPRDLRQALAAAEALLAGGFPLVIADLGLSPIPGGRGRDAQWLRLARAARERGASLLVSAPVRCCGVAAAATLALERHRVRWLGSPRGPRLFDGIEARLVLEKVRGGIGRGRSTTLEEPVLGAERRSRGRSVEPKGDRARKRPPARRSPFGPGGGEAAEDPARDRLSTSNADAVRRSADPAECPGALPPGGKSTCARESASVLGAFSPSGPASIPAFCPRTGSADVAREP